jgi:DNA-binding NarL/FixJ family response regulator
LASSSDKSRLATLTPREFEILRHVARGLSNKDIAKAAEISVHTVERHIANLMARLDIHRRVELAQLALREGFAAV